MRSSLRSSARCVLLGLFRWIRRPCSKGRTSWCRRSDGSTVERRQSAISPWRGSHSIASVGCA
eukprot:8954772-Pyramimonas_sp.AAC.1